MSDIGQLEGYTNVIVQHIDFQIETLCLEYERHPGDVKLLDKICNLTELRGKLLLRILEDIKKSKLRE